MEPIRFSSSIFRRVEPVAPVAPVEPTLREDPHGHPDQQQGHERPHWPARDPRRGWARSIARLAHRLSGRTVQYVDDPDESRLQEEQDMSVPPSVDRQSARSGNFRGLPLRESSGAADDFARLLAAHVARIQERDSLGSLNIGAVLYPRAGEAVDELAEGHERRVNEDGRRRREAAWDGVVSRWVARLLGPQLMARLAREIARFVTTSQLSSHWQIEVVIARSLLSGTRLVLRSDDFGLTLSFMHPSPDAREIIEDNIRALRKALAAATGRAVRVDIVDADLR